MEPIFDARSATRYICRMIRSFRHILVGGLVFSTYIAMTSIADDAVSLVSALPLSATGVLLMLIPVFLILGCLLDGASILVLTIPLLLPGMRSANPS